MTALTTLTGWLLTGALDVLQAAADPVPDEGEVKPGPLALVVVLSLIAASVFLWFSMRKQIGRIRVPRRDELGGHDDERAEGRGPTG